MLRDEANKALDNNNITSYTYDKTDTGFEITVTHADGITMDMRLQPAEMKVYADNNMRHGTILGITNNKYDIELPMCLLHKSWSPETIDAKLQK